MLSPDPFDPFGAKMTKTEFKSPSSEQSERKRILTEETPLSSNKMLQTVVDVDSKPEGNIFFNF